MGGAFCRAVEGRLVATDIGVAAGETFPIGFNPGYPGSLETRVAVGANRHKPGKAPAQWWLDFRNDRDECVGRISIGWENTRYGDIDDERILVAEMFSRAPDSASEGEGGAGKIVWRLEINSGVDMRSGFNTLAVKSDGRGNGEIWIGADSYQPVGRFVFPPGVVAVSISGNVPLDIAFVNICAGIGMPDAVRTWTEDELTARLQASADSREGVYGFLDCDIDTESCRKGGDYRLAVVKGSEGGYDIVYLGGAVENHRAWMPGRIKGKLEPTIFLDHFNLVWYDSAGEECHDGLWADFKGSILELHFPAERGVLRFSRSLPGR